MKWVSIGIAVLYAIFFAYAVHSLYRMPESRCSFEKFNATNYTQSFEACYKRQNELREKHNYVSFVMLGIISIASIIAGMYLNGSVKDGIAGGGVLLLVYASLRYWGNVGEVVRLAVLGAGLVALIIIASKRH